MFVLAWVLASLAVVMLYSFSEGDTHIDNARKRREGERERGGGGRERRERDLICDSIFIKKITVLGHGLIFQPVLACLPSAQRYKYKNDTIMTLQKINITDYRSK